MGDLSNTERDRYLNSIRSGNPQVGIFSVMPAADGTGGTELAQGGYARQNITFNVPVDADPTGRMIVQAARIDFDQATEDWAEAVGLGLWMAGSLISFKTFDGQQTFTVLSGQQWYLPAGAYSITVP